MSVSLDTAKTGANLGDTMYDNYVEKMKGILRLETKLHNFTEKLAELQNDDDVSIAQLGRNRKLAQNLKQKIKGVRAELSTLTESTQLDIGSGPVATHIEAILQKFNIQGQKYHGKSFVGNDCHKYTSLQTYHAICCGIVSKTQELSDNETTIQLAVTTKEKFLKLWQLFSTVHSMVSHNDYIMDETILRIDTAIENYLTYFRERFPHVRISLKQHLLEDHVVPWIMRYHYGFGFFGEQGMESIHHAIRKIAENHSGIVKPLDRLLSTIEEHHLHIQPDIRSHVPPIKKRKSVQ